MKKLAVLILVCLWPCAAGAALKPLFYQGSVDSVDKDGFIMTDTHNQQRSYAVKPPAHVYDTAGNVVALNTLRPHDYVKVLFRVDDPGNAVAVYRILCLTKQEKEAYAKAHMLPQGTVHQ